MAKAVLASILESQLGKFIDGIHRDSLQIGLWSGKISLQNVRLKHDAILNEFEAFDTLFLRIIHGSVRNIRVIVPWNHLMTASVEVFIEGVTLLMARSEDDGHCADMVYKRKKSQLERHEMLWRHKQIAHLQNGQDEKESTFFSRLTKSILDHLQIYITDVHVRYEDDVSYAQMHEKKECMFACGIRIQMLSLRAMKETHEECMSATDVYHTRMLELKQFGLYWDTIVNRIEQSAEVSNVKDRQKFIESKLLDPKGFSDHQYILIPIDLKMRYDKQITHNFKSKHHIQATMSDSELHFTSNQYQNLIIAQKAATSLSARLQTKMRLRNAAHRPFHSIQARPIAWWDYLFFRIVSHRHRPLRYSILHRNMQETQIYLLQYQRLLDAAQLFISENLKLHEVEEEISIYKSQHSELMDVMASYEETYPLDVIFAVRDRAAKLTRLRALEERLAEPKSVSWLSYFLGTSRATEPLPLFSEEGKRELHAAYVSATENEQLETSHDAQRLVSLSIFVDNCCSSLSSQCMDAAIAKAHWNGSLTLNLGPCREFSGCISFRSFRIYSNLISSVVCAFKEQGDADSCVSISFSRAQTTTEPSLRLHMRAELLTIRFNAVWIRQLRAFFSSTERVSSIQASHSTHSFDIISYDSLSLNMFQNMTEERADQALGRNLVESHDSVCKAVKKLCKMEEADICVVLGRVKLEREESVYMLRVEHIQASLSSDMEPLLHAVSVECCMEFVSVVRCVRIAVSSVELRVKASEIAKLMRLAQEWTEERGSSTETRERERELKLDIALDAVAVGMFEDGKDESTFAVIIQKSVVRGERRTLCVELQLEIEALDIEDAAYAHESAFFRLLSIQSREKSALTLHIVSPFVMNDEEEGITRMDIALSAVELQWNPSSIALWIALYSAIFPVAEQDFGRSIVFCGTVQTISVSLNKNEMDRVLLRLTARDWKVHYSESPTSWQFKASIWDANVNDGANNAFLLMEKRYAFDRALIELTCEGKVGEQAVVVEIRPISMRYLHQQLMEAVDYFMEGIHAICFLPSDSKTLTTLNISMENPSLALLIRSDVQEHLFFTTKTVRLKHTHGAAVKIDSDGSRVPPSSAILAPHTHLMLQHVQLSDVSVFATEELLFDDCMAKVEIFYMNDDALPQITAHVHILPLHIAKDAGIRMRLTRSAYVTLISILRLNFGASEHSDAVFENAYRALIPYTYGKCDVPCVSLTIACSVASLCCNIFDSEPLEYMKISLASAALLYKRSCDGIGRLSVKLDALDAETRDGQPFLSAKSRVNVIYEHDPTRIGSNVRIETDVLALFVDAYAFLRCAAFIHVSLDDCEAEPMTLALTIAKMKFVFISDGPRVFGHANVKLQCDWLCENFVQSIRICLQALELVCAGNQILEPCDMEMCIRDPAPTQRIIELRLGNVHAYLSYLDAQCLSRVITLLIASKARFQASDKSLIDWRESYALECSKMTLTVINDCDGCDSAFVQLSLERVNAFVHQNSLCKDSRGMNGGGNVILSARYFSAHKRQFLPLSSPWQMDMTMEKSDNRLLQVMVHATSHLKLYMTEEWMFVFLSVHAAFMRHLDKPMRDLRALSPVCVENQTGLSLILLSEDGIRRVCVHGEKLTLSLVHISKNGSGVARMYADKHFHVQLCPNTSERAFQPIRIDLLALETRAVPIFFSDTNSKCNLQIRATLEQGRVCVRLSSSVEIRNQLTSTVELLLHDPSWPEHVILGPVQSQEVLYIPIVLALASELRVKHEASSWSAPLCMQSHTCSELSLNAEPEAYFRVIISQQKETSIITLYAHLSVTNKLPVPMRMRVKSVYKGSERLLRGRNASKIAPGEKSDVHWHLPSDQPKFKFLIEDCQCSEWLKLQKSLVSVVLRRKNEGQLRVWMEVCERVGGYIEIFIYGELCVMNRTKLELSYLTDGSIYAPTKDARVMVDDAELCVLSAQLKEMSVGLSWNGNMTLSNTFQVDVKGMNVEKECVSVMGEKLFEFGVSLDLTAHFGPHTTVIGIFPRYLIQNTTEFTVLLYEYGGNDERKESDGAHHLIAPKETYALYWVRRKRVNLSLSIVEECCSWSESFSVEHIGTRRIACSEHTFQIAVNRGSLSLASFIVSIYAETMGKASSIKVCDTVKIQAQLAGIDLMISDKDEMIMRLCVQQISSQLYSSAESNELSLSVSHLHIEDVTQNMTCLQPMREERTVFFQISILEKRQSPHLFLQNVHIQSQHIRLQTNMRFLNRMHSAFKKSLALHTSHSESPHILSSGNKLYVHALLIEPFTVYLSFTRPPDQSAASMNSFWLTHVKLKIENARLRYKAFTLEQVLGTREALMEIALESYVKATKAQALSLLDSIHVTTLVSSAVSNSVHSIVNSILGSAPLHRPSLSSFPFCAQSNDAILMRHSKALQECMSYENFVREMQHLIFDWDTNHSGVNARVCVALGIVNHSQSTLFLNVQLHDGAQLRVLPLKRTVIVSSQENVGNWDAKRSAVIFAWGFPPTLLTSGDVYFTLSTDACHAYMTRKAARLKVKDRYSAAFTHEKREKWYSMHIALISDAIGVRHAMEIFKVNFTERVLGLRVTQNEGQVIVYDVLCKTHSIRAGDVVLAVNEEKIHTLSDFRDRVSRAGRPVTLELQRKCSS